MKTMILITVVGSLVLFFSCCSTLFPDEKLSLQRVNYNGNELRIDGYYYYHLKSEKQSNTAVMFLYRDGIALLCGSFPSFNLDVVEENMPHRYDLIKKYKDGWGVFLITGNQIVIEQWNASTGHSLPTMTHTGYIENDTTLRITESYYSDINKTYQVDEVWHFKQFDNKPDSTNVFIK